MGTPSPVGVDGNHEVVVLVIVEVVHSGLVPVDDRVLKDGRPEVGDPSVVEGRVMHRPPTSAAAHRSWRCSLLIPELGPAALETAVDRASPDGALGGRKNHVAID